MRYLLNKGVIVNQLILFFYWSCIILIRNKVISMLFCIKVSMMFFLNLNINNALDSFIIVQDILAYFTSFFIRLLFFLYCFVRFHEGFNLNWFCERAWQCFWFKKIKYFKSLKFFPQIQTFLFWIVLCLMFL